MPSKTNGNKGPLFGVQIAETVQLGATVDKDVLALLGKYEEFAKSENGGSDQPRDRIVNNMLKFALDADPGFKKWLRKQQSGESSGQTQEAASRRAPSSPPSNGTLGTSTSQPAASRVPATQQK